jgi:hypothetical protein
MKLLLRLLVVSLLALPAVALAKDPPRPDPRTAARLDFGEPKIGARASALPRNARLRPDPDQSPEEYVTPGGEHFYVEQQGLMRKDIQRIGDRFHMPLPFGLPQNASPAQVEAAMRRVAALKSERSTVHLGENPFEPRAVFEIEYAWMGKYEPIWLSFLFDRSNRLVSVSVNVESETD